MALVALRLPRSLAPCCDGATRLELQAGTVGEALEEAMARHGRLRPRLLDAEGGLRERLSVFLNDADVRRRLGARLRDGDEIVVLQRSSRG